MSKVEHIAEGVTLYLGDCREILPGLPKADLVVTDPPYLLTTGGDTESHKALGGWIGGNKNDGRPVVCNITWDEVMTAVFGALGDHADAYVMANDKNVILAWNAAIMAGFDFHNLLVWDKRTAVMNRWYMKNCEFVLYLWKGNAKTIRDPSSKQLCTVPNATDSSHPTVKPVELMAHYIRNSSDRGGLVLDPFMGVGSTGVAAMREGRQFIGIEIEPKYFDIACRRVTEESRHQQFDLLDHALDCEGCGQNPADLPGRLCVGCEAYREHQA
jgi:DNA modification methylase